MDEVGETLTFLLDELSIEPICKIAIWDLPDMPSKLPPGLGAEKNIPELPNYGPFSA